MQQEQMELIKVEQEFFINYGQVNNSGTINVEKDSAANSNAVGIYAVNGSEATNNGAIKCRWK